MKIQAPKTKSQTNPNDLNSKSQTTDPSTDLPNDITSGSPGRAKQGDANLVNILVIEI